MAARFPGPAALAQDGRDQGRGSPPCGPHEPNGIWRNKTGGIDERLSKYDVVPDLSPRSSARNLTSASLVSAGARSAEVQPVGSGSSRFKDVRRSVSHALTKTLIEDLVEFEESHAPNGIPDRKGTFRLPTYVDPFFTGVTTLRPEGGIPLLRHRIKLVLVSRIFDTLIGCVIVANSITIGLELTYELENKDTSVIVFLEEVWLLIYVMELCLRLFAIGIRCLHDSWVKFDALLVSVGIINSWLIPLFIDTNDEGLGFLMVMRMMRLGRLARAVRLLVKFKVLWMLVRGLLSSAGTMFYTFVLLTVILYVFAAMGVELITNNVLMQTDEEFRAIAETNFASLPETMLTLVQFVCMDSIAAIYRPLIKKDLLLLCYFTCVILVVPIVLMNLVTAIIVNGAMEQANADKDVQRIYEEQRKARLVRKLKDIFVRLDEDNSGQVSRDEIMNIEAADVQVLQDATSIGDPLEVFNALNVDESDSLSIHDFCDGIWKLATSKASIEVQRMEKQVQLMFKRIKTIESNQSVTNQRLDQIRQTQDRICQSVLAMERDAFGIPGSMPSTATADPLGLTSPCPAMSSQIGAPNNRTAASIGRPLSRSSTAPLAGIEEVDCEDMHIDLGLPVELQPPGARLTFARSSTSPLTADAVTARRGFRRSSTSPLKSPDGGSAAEGNPILSLSPMFLPDRTPVPKEQLVVCAQASVWMQAGGDRDGPPQGTPTAPRPVLMSSAFQD
mmetsp:Transcript_106505/g.306172  ORF Transcript_106505/g.306172 Transcript_106505/m.306172 type:complete len:730 (+) Transcript_106505:61-2250(+)